MFLKKLFSHTIIYAIGPQIPRVASIFILPVLTKYLTTSDYGVYGIITSYIGLLSGLADLGFSIVMANSFFKYPNKWQIIWRQIHFYLIVWSIIYSIIGGLVIWMIMPSIVGFENKIVIVVLNSLPAIFFSPAIILGSRYYQFSQKPVYLASTSAITGIVTIFLNLYTIAFLKMGYMGWFISIFAATALQYIFFFYPVYFKYKLQPLITFRKRFLLENLKVSLPVIPHNYSVYLLNSSDRLIMDRMHMKVDSIGEYNLAYTFGSYFEFIGNAIGMAIGPFYNRIFAASFKRTSEVAYSLTHWLQYGFLLTGFLISLWSKELFSLLFSNPSFKVLYPLAIIIIMGYTYRPYYWLAISRLQFAEKTSQFWKISMIAGLLNVVLNLIFLPIYGVKAAAVTTFISLLYIGFSGFFLDVFKKIEPKRYYPLLMMLLIVISTIVVYLIRDISWKFKLVSTLFLIASFLFYSYTVRSFFYEIE